MALVDFYQLAAVYKLRYADMGSPSVLSPSPTMSATPPPRSPSPAAEPDQAPLPLPPHMQPQLTTPERKRSPAHPVPGITPISRGSSVRQNQEGDTDRAGNYTRGDYDDYIREDLKSRIFVDFEVFMEHILHVPDDWKTRWKPAIDAIGANKEFESHLEEYFRLCNDPRSSEKLLYKPLAQISNVALEALSRSKFKSISPGIPQHYRVNDPNKVQGGVFSKAGLSPDLVVLHEECRLSGGQNVHWANVLHVLEVKPSGSAICDGTNIPRLAINGKHSTSSFHPRLRLTHQIGIDPIANHATRSKLPRHGSKEYTSLTTSVSNPGSPKSKKRPADGSSVADQRPKKKSKPKSKTESASGQVGEGEVRSAQKLEAQCQVDPALQICRYLLEMFSVPLLRSHATVSLIDRERLQLYHANHSVILVSSAIDFSTSNGREMFIANIIAFYCLTLEQNGILETLSSKNAELVQNSQIPTDDRVTQKGGRLEFLGKQGNFVVELVDTISRDPAAVGRSTAVLDATSDRWPKTGVVVKASWPVSGRFSEAVFLEAATEAANKTPDEWATKHLPQVFHTIDNNFKPESTLGMVARMFDEGQITNGEFEYERRTLRVIVQERLHHLKTLGNVRDIGQVFLDVACGRCIAPSPRFAWTHTCSVHRWLLDDPGILHRDLSFNNIMYRLGMEVMGGKPQVYGVLTDYDLSSWAVSLNTDYIKTSQQRTGTPPYMAQELLKGTSDVHLYRHDVESLFYVMLMMCARHTIDPSKDPKRPVVMRDPRELPYQDWFNESSYVKLGRAKGSFFTDLETVELSPAFEDFRLWLEDLQSRFHLGFKAKPLAPPKGRRLARLLAGGPAGGSAGGVMPATSEFDDETLGGYVNYSAIIEPTRYLEGKLKGLDIRYDPSSPSLPTLADEAQADAA